MTDMCISFDEYLWNIYSLQTRLSLNLFSFYRPTKRTTTYILIFINCFPNSRIWLLFYGLPIFSKWEIFWFWYNSVCVRCSNKRKIAFEFLEEFAWFLYERTYKMNLNPFHSQRIQAEQNSILEWWWFKYFKNYRY